MTPSKEAEAMREAIIAAIPGGSICDPQRICDMIRALPAIPAAVVSIPVIKEGSTGGSWRALVEKSQSILVAHLPPDGPGAKETLSELLSVLDGPEYRFVLANDAPAAPVSKPLEGWRESLRKELEIQNQHYGEVAACAAAGSRLHAGERDCTEGVIKGIEYCIERLESLSATAPVADTAQQWISVDTRLPAVGDLVLVFYPRQPHDWPDEAKIRFSRASGTSITAVGKSDKIAFALAKAINEAREMGAGGGSMTDLNDKLPEIEPCPFCGNANEVEAFEIGVGDEDAYECYVFCGECNATGPNANAWRGDAIEAWNRSATPAPQAAPSGLTDAQLDQIARSYFAETYGQEQVKNAIHDALKLAAPLTQAADQSTAGAEVVTAGWQLVPTTPQQGMINAFIAEYERRGGSETGCYHAFLKASPAAPLAQQSVPIGYVANTAHGWQFRTAAPDENSQWAGMWRAVGYISAQQSEPVACTKCGGAGLVDDGEINHYSNGEPFACGPVKCVKDCAHCRGTGKSAAAPLPAQQASERDAKDAARYRYLRDTETLETETLETAVWEALEGNGSVRDDGTFDQADYRAGFDHAVDRAIGALAAMGDARKGGAS